jgi:hypothetical protein
MRWRERLVLIVRASAAHIDHEFENRVERYVSKAAGRAKAIAFREQAEDLSALR